MSKTPVTTGRIDTCRIRQVIEVVFIRGLGVAGDPVRSVTQYWSASDGPGVMLAEVDSWATKEPSDAE